jgi:hypothetical protein
MWSDDAERVVVEDSASIRWPSPRRGSATHPPRVTSTPTTCFLSSTRAPRCQQGQIHYLELDQFIGRRVLVTVHGPLNPVVWLDAALQETRQVNRRMEAGRLRPTSPLVCAASSGRRARSSMINISCPRCAPRRSAAAGSRPTRSAAPHQTQSAATDTPCDHEVRFTCEVPSFKRIWTLRKSKFPLQVRHFRHSELRVSQSVLNDLG